MDDEEDLKLAEELILFFVDEHPGISEKQLFDKYTKISNIIRPYLR